MKTDQVVVQNTTTATAAFNIDTIRFAPQSDDLIHKHFARGHYEQCMALIDQPGHHQTSTTAQYYRSLVLKQEGKLAEAQTCLQQLIKTSPNNLLYLKEMARIL